MDDFLPEILMQQAHDELLVCPEWWYDPHHPGNQVQKYYIPAAERPELTHSLWSLRNHAPVTAEILQYLNSEPVLAWLSEITGIGPLHRDDTWLGAGVHRIESGGFLDIHADFNVNWQNGLYRRLNLLIYLNPDWQPQWGGDLEIWDKDMTRCCRCIEPIMNRAVLMRITDDAYHGHPRPLATPRDRSRLSLALYYYTTDRPDHEKARQHGVVWQNRTG